MRWGKTACPSSCSTSLVYSGRVAGTFFRHQGGAADFLCLPDDPEFDDYIAGYGGTQSRQVDMLFYIANKNLALTLTLGGLGVNFGRES